MTQGELAVMANLQRKAEQAAAMFSRLVAEMNHALSLQQRTRFDRQTNLPTWLH